MLVLPKAELKRKFKREGVWRGSEIGVCCCRLAVALGLRPSSRPSGWAAHEGSVTVLEPLRDPSSDPQLHSGNCASPHPYVPMKITKTINNKTASNAGSLLSPGEEAGLGKEATYLQNSSLLLLHSLVGPRQWWAGPQEQ